MAATSHPRVLTRDELVLLLATLTNHATDEQLSAALLFLSRERLRRKSTPVPAPAPEAVQ